MTQEEFDRWSTDLGRHIGGAISAARKAAGMSRDSLAERVGLSRNGIVNLELGRAANLRVSIVLAIAAALGVPPASLLFPDVLAEVEVLPGKSVTGLAALGWFIGAGGSVGLVRDMSYAPDGVVTDSSMRIPLALLQIDLRIAQCNYSLMQSEGLQPHAANEAALSEMRDEAATTRKTLEALESERDRLVSEYRKRLNDA